VALAHSVESIRAEFPALAGGVTALDGAGGTHAPAAVIEAVVEGLRFAMSNLGGAFAQSARSVETVAAARRAIADLVGGVADGVVLGPNMTTLTFHIADALSCEWRPGDEVVVTSLDHDANIRPWVWAAQRAGATIRWAEVDAATGELPGDAFDGVIGERTRLVALTAASNLIGTRPDVRRVANRAHAVGALTYVDGVHATPHTPTDVVGLGADFYTCSTYKLFGPHTGTVVADPELLARLHPAKLVPAPTDVPGRFERGTPPIELLAGVTAAVDWIAGLTDAEGSRRDRVISAFAAVEEHLGGLLERTVNGLQAIDGVRLLGSPRRRTSTLAFVVDGHTPRQVAEELGRRNIAVWDGDNYAYELMRRFGLRDSGGAVRASLVLYNDAADVDRLLEGVADLASR
jgi:cysteine desulfurase family protein (TIGR01976 family)